MHTLRSLCRVETKLFSATEIQMPVCCLSARVRERMKMHRVCHLSGEPDNYSTT